MHELVVVFTLFTVSGNLYMYLSTYLSSCRLPVLRPPYLYSIHNSPPKCIEAYQDVPKDVWQSISQTGRVQLEMVYKSRYNVWPIDGGVLEHVETDGKDLVITG